MELLTKNTTFEQALELSKKYVDAYDFGTLASFGIRKPLHWDPAPKNPKTLRGEKRSPSPCGTAYLRGHSLSMVRLRLLAWIFH